MELNNGAFGGGSSGSGGSASQADIDLIKRKLASTVFQTNPAEGAVVSAPSTVSVILVIELTPSTDLNALTVTLPPTANAPVGQRVFVHSTKQISELNFTSDGTVDNRMVSMSAGDSVDFTKTNATTWSRGV